MAGVEHVRPVVVVEDAHQTAPVPIVGDAAAVVDVARRVDEHLRRAGDGRVTGGMMSR